MIKTVTDSNFDEVASSDRLLVLDFWAEWCKPCSIMSKVLPEITEKYTDKVDLGKVDTEENDDLVSKFKIKSLPTFLFIKKGKVIDSIFGGIPSNKLSEKIDSLL